MIIKEKISAIISVNLWWDNLGRLFVKKDNLAADFHG